MIIRKYEEKDYAEVLNLLALNTPTYFAPAEEKDFIDYLHHHIELYYVIEKQGLVVGCGGINFQKDKNKAVISWDIIHPDYQGKGVGTLLLKYRIEVIHKLDDIQIIQVRTSQHSFPFYEKNGFELVGIYSNYWAEAFDLYDMKRANIE